MAKSASVITYSTERDGKLSKENPYKLGKAGLAGALLGIGLTLLFSGLALLSWPLFEPLGLIFIGIGVTSFVIAGLILRRLPRKVRTPIPPGEASN